MDLHDDSSASEGINRLKLLKHHTLTPRQVLIYIDTALKFKDQIAHISLPEDR